MSIGGCMHAAVSEYARCGDIVQMTTPIATGSHGHEHDGELAQAPEIGLRSRAKSR
jgi:hypothetical protein